MTPNPSYPSHDTFHTRRPNALQPRSSHEFDMLARVVEAGAIPPAEVAKTNSMDPDHLDRLMRGSSGKAFMSWFRKYSMDTRSTRPAFPIPQGDQ